MTLEDILALEDVDQKIGYLKKDGEQRNLTPVKTGKIGMLICMKSLWIKKNILI